MICINTGVCKNWEVIISSGKFDDQQKYAAITEAAMVYTTEGITNNIPMSVGPMVNKKKSNKSKLLSQFW